MASSTDAGLSPSTLARPRGPLHTRSGGTAQRQGAGARLPRCVARQEGAASRVFLEVIAMNVEIEFPGGVQVAARFNGFLLATDQSPEHGGGRTAPQPFDLFLASLGTCAGFNALRFCQERGFET